MKRNRSPTSDDATAEALLGGFTPSAVVAGSAQDPATLSRLVAFATTLKQSAQAAERAYNMNKEAEKRGALDKAGACLACEQTAEDAGEMTACLCSELRICEDCVQDGKQATNCVKCDKVVCFNGCEIRQCTECDGSIMCQSCHESDMPCPIYLLPCACKEALVCQECVDDDKKEEPFNCCCEGCENIIVCLAGECDYGDCEACGSRACQGCMTETRCGNTKLCEVCAEDYDCVDCDMCDGYY
jgi:hypothetical protein